MKNMKNVLNKYNLKKLKNPQKNGADVEVACETVPKYNPQKAKIFPNVNWFHIR